MSHFQQSESYRELSLSRTQRVSKTLSKEYSEEEDSWLPVRRAESYRELSVSPKQKALPFRQLLKESTKKEERKLPYLQKKYSYLRCTVADLNGIPRGKVIPYKQVENTLRHGLTLYAGSVYIGPNGELPSHALRRITADGEPNVIFDPDLSTFVIRENGTGKATAEILGSLKVKQNGLLVPSPYCPTPREVALSQLKRLEELDMYLLAGTEMEFYLLEKEQGSEKLKPLFQNLDIFNHIVFAEHEKLLFELENIIGDVETMHCEYGPGQFEFSLKAKEGIAAADKVFYFKYTVKEWCLSQGQREEVGRRRNLSANFMSKPYGSSNGSGAHFNHSIWRKSTGENMFADASDPEGLSSTAKHWVAGLVEHADALTALCCPTYNCYRRLHLPWAPDTASWGVDDRQASFRMVNRDTSTTYLENRIPGMASNPYIVMAATVAAGLDGVIRKLDCPSRGTQDAKLLVKDLGEALEALRRDEVMCSALGEGFIDAFIDCKTEVELTSFKHHDPSSTDEKQYQAEWNIYKHI